MNVIRQIVEVKNHSIQVNLPEDFSADRVEVIILLPEEDDQIAEETKLLLNERLESYRINPNQVSDFDEFIEEINED